MEYIRLKDVDFKSKINGRVFVNFLAKDVSVRLQKDKVTKFICLNMADKDRIVDAKLFGATQAQIDLIQNNKTFNAALDVKPYDKSPDGFSCIVYNIEESQTPPEYFADWSDDIPGSQKIIENALGEIISSIYGQITYPIMVKYWPEFSYYSAAKNQHHTELGALLTHTAEVVKLADDMGDFFNNKYGADFINKSLLLAAAMLHDIGKVKELDVDRLSGNTEYSIVASLSTHIMDVLAEVDIQSYKLGLGIQSLEVNEINEEEPTKTEEQLKDEIEAVMLLKHALASHHGRLDYGSPITPNIPEAYILNRADEMSAEMYRYNRAFKGLESGKSVSVWAGSGLKSTYKECNK